MNKRRPFVRPMPPRWWCQNPVYIGYMAREATSLFVGGYSLVLLTGLVTLSQGKLAYDRWLTVMQHPLLLMFHALALVAALFHTLTWLALTPKVLHLHFGAEKVPDRWVIAGHYAGFVLLSVLLLTIVARGET